MGFSETAGESSAVGKRRNKGPATVEFLDADILFIVFSFLDLFDLVRCAVVCKSWNAIIKRSKLLQVLCHKMQQSDAGSPRASTSLQNALDVDLEKLAMRHHRLSLQQGQIDIDQWKGHSVRAAQCRMKMGLVLTGVGDKVLRLWSVEKYKCIEEYTVPDTLSLVDFDFDEGKVVGLVGTRVCIWRRNGQRSIFPSREGMFPRGLCMRYYDPEAVIGCEDGTARVFDMYSKRCSRIIRMHGGPLTCLCLNDDQLILSGSSLGRVTVSDPLSDHQVATLKSANSTGGIRTLCFNGRSNLVFAGTTGGYVSCWDLRKMRRLWESRISPNVVYSLQHMVTDTSVLAAGGIDGVLRIMNQNSGEVLSSCVMDDKSTTPSSSRNSNVIIERKKGRRLPVDFQLDKLPRRVRPPITCLAVGMKKVVTTHDDKYISLWKFNY